MIIKAATAAVEPRYADCPCWADLSADVFVKPLESGISTGVWRRRLSTNALLAAAEIAVFAANMSSASEASKEKAPALRGFRVMGGTGPEAPCKSAP